MIQKKLLNGFDVPKIKYIKFPSHIAFIRHEPLMLIFRKIGYIEVEPHVVQNHFEEE